jgi:hypothetical protein
MLLLRSSFLYSLALSRLAHCIAWEEIDRATDENQLHLTTKPKLLLMMRASEDV